MFLLAHQQRPCLLIIPFGLLLEVDILVSTSESKFAFVSIDTLIFDSFELEVRLLKVSVMLWAAF